jgi:hypothetical protein
VDFVHAAFGGRVMGPPDPEMRNRPAGHGTAYRKEPISTHSDSETPTEVQERSFGCAMSADVLLDVTVSNGLVGEHVEALVAELGHE